jgi:hypothetical protein
LEINEHYIEEEDEQKRNNYASIGGGVKNTQFSSIGFQNRHSVLNNFTNN